MGNMSYCRFENTASDARDCLNAIEEAATEGQSIGQFYSELSSYEQAGLRSLINSAAALIDLLRNGDDTEELLKLIDMDARDVVEGH